MKLLISKKIEKKSGSISTYFSYKTLQMDDYKRSWERFPVDCKTHETWLLTKTYSCKSL